MITFTRGSTAKLNTNGGDHPCILLNEPIKYKGRNSVLQVHLTSSKRDPRDPGDPACVFKAGDDKLITKDCWVYYEEAEIRHVADVTEEIRKRNLTLRRISREAYMRILEGLLLSEKTSEPVREFIMEAIRQGKAG